MKQIKNIIIILIILNLVGVAVYGFFIAKVSSLNKKIAYIEAEIRSQDDKEKELKQIAKERFGDLEEREMLSWIRYNFMQYREGAFSRDHLKETLILGIESILENHLKIFI